MAGKAPDGYDKRRRIMRQTASRKGRCTLAEKTRGKF